uniref:Gag-Pol polyprotein n=1 Tax=Tanacetum cinerariifolium TaxID=118510 RepID=A0A699GYG5_TANCI|nr:Gag-Pol polyprotein [Tanacetum cinerariifolium]
MATKYEIKKFNGNNFSLWKLKMKDILRKDKCLAAIGERPAEVTDDSKWDEIDGNAIANLHLALPDGVLSSIEEKKTAKDIWDHLAQLYEARSLHNKIFLKRKLYALRMTESTSVTEHVNNLNTLFSQLASLDCKIDVQERAKILLQSLPDSYDQVVINLTNNVLTDCLVFDDVAASILEEENRHNNRDDSGSHNHGKSKTGKKKNNFKCFKCGKQGHFKKDCRGSNTSNPQGNVASTSDDGNAMCCEAAVANEGRKRFADVWLFDTGATFHMTARREWFHQYKPISEGGYVYSCNDHELKIIGIGSIMVKMHDGEKVATNLYQLKGNIMEEAEASVASHSPSHKVAISWHQKLGHMSEQGMKILVDKKLLPGLTKVSLPFCEYCVISKQNRLKFKASNSRSVSVLELVHSDVWQAPVQSLRGAKYFVSFIDDYSRRYWVYPIKKKSDVFEVFKVYKARVELDSRTKIKCLRTDNEGEYTGDEFDLFCRQEGIKRQFTIAYTPQRNRVAERMNKTLLERAREMLATASLGKSFWAEAVNTACYVINRSPSTAVELKTPMEMWTGNPFKYSDLHIFGVPMYNEEGVSTTRETTTIQMEKEFQSNDSSEAIPHHEVNEMIESQAPTTQDGEPSTLQEVLNNPDASFWKEAMQEEIKALPKNKTWELVPLPGGRNPFETNGCVRSRETVMIRWRGIVRLVVKGYAQKEGIDFNEIFSHVVRMTTIQVVLAMCAAYDLHLEQLDVKTAFLYRNLEEEIYMLQPEGFKQKGKENLVCKLNKSLYGLKQTPRYWYKRFDSFIRSLEYNRLHADPCAYFKRFGNNDFIILLLYVDDMLVAGPNKDRINKLKAQLAREFEMKDLGPANKILGMQIHRDRVSRKIWLSQKSYVNKILQRFNMQDYESKSTTGCVFTLSGRTVSWVSKLQSVVAMSTTEAEYVAAAQASKEAVWLKMLLEELGWKTWHVKLVYQLVGQWHASSTQI